MPLYAGADDYIVKPFHEQELAARIYTALRRRIPGGTGKLYQAGDLKIDFSRRQVSLAGEGDSFFASGIPDSGVSCPQFRELW